MTDKPTVCLSGKFTKHEKKLYNTLDVFAQGKTGKLHHDTSENQKADNEATSQQSTAILSDGDGQNNNYEFEPDTRDINRPSETVLLQTGAKLYHGKNCEAIDKDNDEVEDSVKEFLRVPAASSSTSGNGNVKKEAFCYLWFPDDRRRWVCEEGFNYLRKGLKERGVTLKVDHVDMKHYNVDFPVLILCVHPPEEKTTISLGDMEVILVILHRQPHPPGDPEPPLANDLYWKGYRNLSLILDMTASSLNAFRDTQTNVDTTFRLAEFLKRWA